MGCDIHVHAEKREGNRWVKLDLPQIPHGSYSELPFESRQYGKFGFLADVRNYSAIQPIAQPRGVPDDMSPETKHDYEGCWDMDAHSASWLSLEELASYDYDRQVEDRRYTQQTGPNSFNGGATCEPGKGEKKTLREFLSHTDFFESLEVVKAAGADRIIFWFDN